MYVSYISVFYYINRYKFKFDLGVLFISIDKGDTHGGCTGGKLPNV